MAHALESKGNGILKLAGASARPAARLHQGMLGQGNVIDSRDHGPGGGWGIAAGGLLRSSSGPPAWKCSMASFSESPRTNRMA